MASFSSLGQIQRAQHTGVFQLRQAFFQRGQLNLRVFIAAFGFLERGESRVREVSRSDSASFGVVNVDIFRRVHVPRDVNNVIVFKTANHMADGFGFYGCWSKLVAREPSPLDAPFTEARDIHELHGGWQDALRFDDFSRACPDAGSGIGTTPVFGSMVQKGSWPLQYPLW
ncbi:hypothetical protein LN650_12505 [Klebsiella pneumoniae subsp. pneumoniae]|nr:hypothetical protein [Klebsiella pneumoniae subsp. pneumoniae]